MADMYGTDGSSISANNMVYATDVNLHLMCPGSTSSGTVTWCRLPASSLIDNDIVAALSVNELLKSKYKTVNVTDTHKDFKLSNALVDDALVRYVSHQISVEEDSKYGMEWINILVLNTPFVSPF